MRTRIWNHCLLLALAATGGCGAGAEAPPAPTPTPAPAAAPAPAPDEEPGPAPAPIEYQPGREICWLANREINESSGLAASRGTPGVFWTHNDSGGQPELYAFNDKGENLGTFRVPGARSTDWEDISSFRSGGRGGLVVADTGDNARIRGRYTLYICQEPDPGPSAATAGGGDLKLLRKVALAYEDGKSYDGENVAAEPDGRRVFLASRDRNARDCRIFVVELYAGADGTEPVESAKAREIARHPWQDVTAMDIAPDNRHAVLQTYTEAYQFVRAPGQTWDQAFKGTPTVIKLPPRRQGEGIAYGHDGRTLFLTSEDPKGCPFYIVEAKPEAPKPGG